MMTIQKEIALREVERLKIFCSAEGNITDLTDLIIIERFLLGKSYATSNQILTSLKNILKIDRDVPLVFASQHNRLMLEVTSTFLEQDVKLELLEEKIEALSA